MTNEEAIIYLKQADVTVGRDIKTKTAEALEMAIKALEHPERNVVAIIPCGDTISRQAVIDLMMQKWGENFSGDDAMQESIDAIREMPSVTPQEPKTGYWIPTYGNVKCSVCGSVKDSREVGKATHYCDFCGAKMIEPQESEET